ncbi:MULTISPECIES: hypothetical protein, partial [unclassified Streptomyces]|uniref:hypothetical protein n=1 Tax=unclassified Streptomyces TaxID=2593676 RepID=UPI001C40879A
MTAFAVVGPALAIAVLIGGILLTASSHRGGVAAIIVGALGIAFWLVMIPLARRKKQDLDDASRGC